MSGLTLISCPLRTSLCPHHSVVRSLATSTVYRVYNELTDAKNTPTSGVAINTRIRKLNFPPFVKDLFGGVFNKSMMSYAEVLNYGRHMSLEHKMKELETYLESKKESLAMTDQTGKLPPEVLHAFKNSGMFGLSVPTEYGGADFLITEVAKIFEVLGEEISLAEFMNNTEFLGGCQAILNHGTDAQKHKYLPMLTSGNMLATFCLAEEGTGSDPSSVSVTARETEDGDCYLLNGTKTWVVRGADADIFTVFAKLEMRNYLGEEDSLVTAFLVDKGFGGVEVSEPRRLTGLKGLDLCDVTFRDCKVPKSAVLGTEGEGLAVLSSILHHNKFLMAAGIITHLRNLLNETISWTNDRAQFGLHLSNFTLIKHQLAQMAARIYCLEAMVYLTAGLYDVADVPDVELESVLVKLYAAETSDFITKGCLDILGMRACMEDSKYQRYLRDNQVIQSWQGTNNILKCFAGITGVIHLTKMEEKLQKLRQPMGNPVKHLRYQWDTRQHKKDKYPLKYKLSDCVHPRLISSAEKVEWSAHKLHWVASELVLYNGSNLQIEEKCLERLSDIAMEVFASVCALSRASRSYIVGNSHADHEISLVVPYIFESRLRVKENAWKCVNYDIDQGNRDSFWVNAAEYMTKRGGYQPVHPLTKNSF